MAKRELPPTDLLRKLLDYDPETGTLTWLPRPIESFATVGAGKVWNKCFAGKKAFAHLDGTGYRAGTLLNKTYTAHRIIWKLVYGEDPTYIDHIDQDKLNNALSNLRNVTATESNRNLPMNPRNTSGVTGVMFHKRRGKWVAQMKGWRGKSSFIGSYATKQEAVEARRNAEKLLGYHPNHGLKIAARPQDEGE